MNNKQEDDSEIVVVDDEAFVIIGCCSGSENKRCYNPATLWRIVDWRLFTWLILLGRVSIKIINKLKPPSMEKQERKTFHRGAVGKVE